MKRCAKCSVNQRNIKFSVLTAAKDGLQSYCKLCMNAAREECRLKHFTQDPWLYIFKQKRNNAATAGVEFTLTEEWLRANNTEACPYTGIPFRFTEPGTSNSGWSDKSPNAPTFDRIDSDEGYTPENTEIVSWRYNRFKMELHPEELEWMCRCILEKIDATREDEVFLRMARA